jgi:hypothetical protein
VELYEYTENEDEFCLFMEYANDPDYIANKILEVGNALLLTIIQQHTPIGN